MLKEFKAFALKGNMLDLAIGVIIGGAFSAIVSSLVNDILMPVLSIFTGSLDFTNWFVSLDGNKYLTLADAQTAGAATVNYGTFLSGVINFLIMAFVVFIFVKQINKLRSSDKPQAPTTKKCEHCQSDINIKATKCPFCTSSVK